MNGAPSVSTDGPRLPRQVQQRAKLAERLQKQQQERLNGSDPSSQTPPPAPAATDDPKAASAPESNTPPDARRAPIEQPPTPDGAEVPGAAAVNGADPGGEQLDPAAKHWRNRYHSVMGVLRTERERHSGEVGELNLRIAELQSQLAQAKTSTGQPADLKLEDYFSAEQIDALGEDRAAEMLRLSQRLARQQVQQQVEAALEPIRQREKLDRERVQRTQQQQQEDARQAMFDAMTEAVPNWVEINKTEGWLRWLAVFDEQALRTRDQILQEALAVNDAVPVITLLRRYTADTQGARAKPPVLPAANDVGGGPPGAAAQPEPEERLTPAEVKRMYTRIATDRTITDAERDKRRAELDARVKKAFGPRTAA